MEYRKFGNLDWEVSSLGFGAMRLPTDGDESSNIAEKEAIEMIRYAIDNGVNYVDTAWPYHGEESEKLVAKALKDGYREKTRVATKLPIWLVDDKEDLDKYLNKQLEKLEVDKIDFYLIHALSKDRWQKCKDLEIMDWLKKVQKEGKIGYKGFSFHDDYDLFEDIVDYYEDDWDFCQIQYNYLDTEYQAGQKGLKYAADKGLAVVVMEPLRGGTLAKEPPKEIKKIWDKADKKRSAPDWALQWLWNQEEVSVVLSGMSTLEQVKENVESASNSGINSLDKSEKDLIEKAADKFREMQPVNCTGCGYCVPCPNDVHIPMNFSLYNEAHLYDDYEEKNNTYNRLKAKMRAENCIACGECLDKCPQNLSIIDLLEDVADYFEVKEDNE
ncbi:MAG TPA: aldo/keto reductase [Halanaerobiales bacterium]|nr:aldo/keto reductase [Halanaerobiales bacterium]